MRKKPFETRSHYGALVFPEVTKHTRLAQSNGNFPPSLRAGISGMPYHTCISRGENYVSPLKTLAQVSNVLQTEV